VAEETTRTLVGTWIQYLKNNRGQPSPTPKDFATDFNNSINEVIRCTIAEFGTDQAKARQSNESVQKVREAHVAAFHRLGKLRDVYATRYQLWDTLHNERRQHARAITIDHVKLFISRLLYAVMIAAVFLTASWIAKLLEIPLPMFRMP
jgi:hypothetical protein